MNKKHGRSSPKKRPQSSRFANDATQRPPTSLSSNPSLSVADEHHAMPKDKQSVLHLLERAFARRHAFGALSGTDIRRWVHGEADGLPGLVVESYAQCARLELKDARYIPWVDAIGKKLIVLGMSGVVFVHRTGKKAEVRPLVGECPRGIVAYERGGRFFVRLIEGDAVGTGIFVDLREGREQAERYAKGRPFLNLFAHAGAYGVAALRGGASRIDHVDSGKKTASWAALNLALNGGDPRAHRFIIDDAFDFLERAGRRGPTYGFIACDPPTTALRPKGKRFLVRESLPVLAADSCRALLPDGHLLLTCNDRSLTTQDVDRAAREAAKEAGRDVKRVVPLTLPADLPKGGDVPVRGVLLSVK
ncbi:MAG: hypothetical protein GY822_11955 [Deltaproteobacteria bacterium]|nr:hypothetical protein [Deltaproteobacteria bacterium]